MSSPRFLPVLCQRLDIVFIRHRIFFLNMMLQLPIRSQRNLFRQKSPIRKASLHLIFLLVMLKRQQMQENMGGWQTLIQRQRFIPPRMSVRLLFHGLLEPV